PSPLRIELPEMRDRFCAVGGVVAGVHARVVLREVPAAIPVDANQFFIALARNQHDRAVWNVNGDAVTHLFDQVGTGVRREPWAPRHFRATMIAGDCSSPSAR